MLEQDIAPVYYNLEDFAKGEIKTALQKAADKVRRKQAMKGSR
jgi:pre-mRNA-splicing factor ATP-dependent RNA helicase DHX15/PRP43